uniref:aminopeptidase family protein P n=1 Tax=uncultured Bartonella sp. TaxID=104108 RepID=UPI002604D77C
KIFDYEDLISCPPHLWLQQNTKGLTIGFDPWLHTVNGVKTLQKSVEETAGGKLVGTNNNLVDLIWPDQPEPPLTPVSIQPLDYAGITADKKLQLIAEELQKNGCDLTILTDPSSIAWVFNIRGNDVSNTPFPLSFAILRAHGRPSLFIDHRKLGDNEQKYLAGYVDVFEPSALLPEVIKQAKAKATFALDGQLSAEKFHDVIIGHGGTIKDLRDAARLPRAIKNEAELEGARHAHLRDGVALCRFFSWLSREKPGAVNEISAAGKLEFFRTDTALKMGSKLEDLSFDTISGSGANGAIIHYRVNTATNRPLEEGNLYLVDSGAQYRDGTTDVTRTVAVGQAGDEEKRCFTLVLKGLIDLSTARFPKGSRGQDLDVLARIALWNAGLDFTHGTGHGVGSYLAVHEGPQTISKRGVQELLPGMIISNEPGYYREGAFGIRIENLLVVKPAKAIKGGDIAMLGFETLTHCPIDRNLIVVDMLTKEERDWLNDYHSEVLRRNAPHLDATDRKWLEAATRPL